MATLQSSSFLNSSTIFYSSSSCQKGRSMQEHQDFINGCYTNRIEQQLISPSTKNDHVNNNISPDPVIIMKIYAIKEAVADRVEMHKNIGEQRSQWNTMLLNSINSITLVAATITAIVATSSSPFLGLNLCSTLMYLAATGLLVIMNQLQPSQLAEEQRNAARLFQNLLHQIDTTLSIGHPVTTIDVNIAMEKVLALDKAYPLPLLGTMLDKFPSKIEPAVWWPQQRRSNSKRVSENRDDWNGWNEKLEEEMRHVTKILKEKDQEEYIRLGKKALKLNKILAISGPLLTGLAAIGSAFVGCSYFSSWAAVIGVGPGALASVVNTIQHGGQVGMIFEMYRSNAGFFKYMKESIESTLMEKDVEKRENGEVFEMKLALMLGRSLSELRDLSDSYSSCKKEQLDEFASKLF
ncbi:probable F-box protein At4g22030 [Lycium ferocissimum]|uniref:probable F-box protein At4g22030 n=1 Tax=Lycium ferocissimum TaxID=112874 RepID=UPI0028169332|nr:probable F-box protein At4g22030 [Lycium ferocissimum]